MISWVMDKNWFVRSERHRPWATEPQSVLVLLEICPRCNKISSSCTWHLTLTRIEYMKGHSVLDLWPPTFYHQHQGIKILLAFSRLPNPVTTNYNYLDFFVGLWSFISQSDTFIDSGYAKYLKTTFSWGENIN